MFRERGSGLFQGFVKYLLCSGSYVDKLMSTARVEFIDLFNVHCRSDYVLVSKPTRLKKVLSCCGWD